MFILDVAPSGYDNELKDQEESAQDHQIVDVHASPFRGLVDQVEGVFARVAQRVTGLGSRLSLVDARVQQIRGDGLSTRLLVRELVHDFDGLDHDQFVVEALVLVRRR